MMQLCSIISEFNVLKFVMMCIDRVGGGGGLSRADIRINYVHPKFYQSGSPKQP